MDILEVLEDIIDVEAVIIKEYEEDAIEFHGDYIKVLSGNRKKAEKLIKKQIEKEEEGLIRNARENFINDILDFRFEDIDLMLNRSEILGFDFYIKRRAILIEIEDMYRMLKDQNELRLQKYKSEIAELIQKSTGNEKDIVAYIGRNSFVLCKVEEENIYEKVDDILKSLKSRWDLNFKIAIGDIYDISGLESISCSYKDSVKYMAAGKRFLKKKNIYSFKNISTYFLLDNLDKYEARKIMKFIEPIADYGEKENIDIFEVIEKFFINKLVLSKTGEDTSLGAKRIKKIIEDIKEILEIDITKFEIAVKVYLAIKYWKSRVL